MKIELVETIKDYLYLINQFENRRFQWFRGHTESNFRLEPTLYRGKKAIVTGQKPIQFRHYEVSNEDIAIKEFKKNYEKIYNTKFENNFECLYKMQHSGIPTRLLDFTTNPLVALFFSVVNEKETKFNPELFEKDLEFKDDCSAIFSIDPLLINFQSNSIKKVADLTYIKYNSIYNLRTPLCIEPKNYDIDERLKIQEGKFVLFGSETNPLDWYDVFRNNILKLLIPNNARPKILKELDKKFGINYSSIYPDKEGIKFQTIKKVENSYKKL